MRWRVAVLVALVGCAPQVKDSGKVTIHNKEAAAIDTTGGSVGIDDGSTVTLPPGALAVGSNVTVQKVAAPAEFGGTGAPIASDPVAIVGTGPDGNPLPQAASAMTIALTVNGGTALALAAATDDNLCVLLKDAAGSLFFWRRAAIVFDDGTNIAKVQSTDFGTYQVVYCGSDPLPGFTDATLTIGAGSGALYAVDLTVPAGMDVDLAPGKSCVMALLDASAGSGGGTDTGAGTSTIAASVEGAATAAAAASGVGSSQAAASGPVTVVAVTAGSYQAGADTDIKLEVPALQVAAANKYLIALALLDGAGACPFKVGDNLADGHSLTGMKSFYAFNITAAALAAGVTGRVGDAGPFQLGPVNVDLGGPGAFAAFPEVEAPVVCFAVDTDFGHVFRQVAFSKGEISGKNPWPLGIPFVGSTTTTKLNIDARVGQDCSSLNEAASDPAKGLPYRVTIRDTNAATNSTYYLTPVTLNIAPTTPSGQAAASGGENGCLEIATPGGLDSGSGNLGQVMVSLAAGSYALFLPFLTTASSQVKGVPQYDLRVTMLAAGKDCTTKTSTDIAVPLPGRPLTQTIQVQF